MSNIAHQSAVSSEICARWVTVSDQHGCPYMIPEATYRHLLKAGHTSYAPVLDLTEALLPDPPAAKEETYSPLMTVDYWANSFEQSVSWVSKKFSKQIIPNVRVGHKYRVSEAYLSTRQRAELAKARPI